MASTLITHEAIAAAEALRPIAESVFASCRPLRLARASSDPSFGDELDERKSRRIDAEWQLGDHKIRFGYDTEKFESGHAGTEYTGGAY